NAHSNKFRRLATGLTTIETTPVFGIGQRAILARTPAGNVLWDCITLIDDATIDLLNGLGGVTAIAIAHPHYYTTMVEWSRALGGVPIHLHAADREWVMCTDPAVKFWEGDTKPIGGPHTGSAGRTLRRRNRPALGGLGRRSWRIAVRRHSALTRCSGMLPCLAAGNAPMPFLSGEAAQKGRRRELRRLADQRYRSSIIAQSPSLV